MFSLLRSRPEGEGHLVETPGFALGLDRHDYYKLLAESCIVPCPSGPFTPETFRFYEALEAGCIPVPAPTAPCGGWPPGFDYWSWRYPELIGQETGLGFIDTIEMLLDRLVKPQETMTRTLAWWLGEKRKYVHELVDDCRDLGATVPEPKVTVLISVSPVPSHPSVDMLDATILKVRSYPDLARAEVIIMCDGVRPELEHRRNDYEEFLRVMVDRCNWDPCWFGCLPVIHDEWLHQAEMTRRALEMVRTPLVFFVEHDTFPMGEIPFGKFFACFDGFSPLNHLRLHIFDGVHPEHERIYSLPPPLRCYGVPIQGTSQYSQRPHLARTEWMKGLMARYFEPHQRTFIEDRLTSPAEAGELNGLYVYAPEGSWLRSGTVDGRGSDPKAPILLEGK